jgi:tripartite-type tricarboxylate transporter receptor subunit TctC
MNRIVQLVLLGTGFAVATVSIRAQEGPAASYPSRPIRLIVPLAAGGPSDLMARTLAHKLTEAIRQNVVVDNRPGASGVIGTEIAAKSPPDGYTILLVSSAISINPSLFRKLPYDTLRDLAPVSLLAGAPYILAVHPSLPVRSVKELVALAKARPGAINYGSGGSGSPAHLIGELFRSATGVRIVHVPYKTVAQAVTDLVAGEVQVMFVVSTAAVPQIEAGRIRGLAVTSLRRLRAVPHLPTMDEAGVPGFEATAWYGFLAPAGTPPEIVESLYRATVRALGSPEVEQRLRNLGLEPVGSDPRAFAGFIESELAKWAKAARDSGARVE